MVIRDETQVSEGIHGMIHRLESWCDSFTTLVALLDADFFLSIYSVLLSYPFCMEITFTMLRRQQTHRQSCCRNDYSAYLSLVMRKEIAVSLQSDCVPHCF